jgi:hypothetical protein
MLNSIVLKIQVIINAIVFNSKNEIMLQIHDVKYIVNIKIGFMRTLFRQIN